MNNFTENKNPVTSVLYNVYNSEERPREVVFYDVIFVVSASGPQWWLGCLKVQRRMSGDIYDDWDGLPDHLASAITFYMVNSQPPARPGLCAAGASEEKLNQYLVLK